MVTYASFADLQTGETAGLDYRIRVRHGPSGIAIMAVHGGGIEPGTSEIAEAVAGPDHSFYSFSGLKPSGNAGLHLSSRKFDEPLAVAVVGAASSVVTIHGCRDRKAMTYVGGRHRQLKLAIKRALRAAGFPVTDAMRFPGVNPKNICNRGRSGMGVQLEVSLGMRQQLFADLRRVQRRSGSASFEAYVAALRRGISRVCLEDPPSAQSAPR